MKLSSKMSRSTKKQRHLQTVNQNFHQKYEFRGTSREHPPRCSTEPLPATLNCSVCEGPLNPRQGKQTRRSVACLENPTMQRRSGQFLIRARKITTKMSQHHLRSKSSGDCGFVGTTRLVKQKNDRRRNVFVEDLTLLQGQFEAIAGKVKKVSNSTKVRK